jgi:hypothetical protein
LFHKDLYSFINTDKTIRINFNLTPMVLNVIPKIKHKTASSFELRLPVLFLSGIQHIAGTPDGMNKMPDFVVNYLKDIPTNWDGSKFVEGYHGKYIVMAKKRYHLAHCSHKWRR